MYAYWVKNWLNQWLTFYRESVTLGFNIQLILDIFQEIFILLVDNKYLQYLRNIFNFIRTWLWQSNWIMSKLQKFSLVVWDTVCPMEAQEAPNQWNESYSSYAGACPACSWTHLLMRQRLSHRAVDWKSIPIVRYSVLKNLLVVWDHWSLFVYCPLFLF